MNNHYRDDSFETRSKVWQIRKAEKLLEEEVKFIGLEILKYKRKRRTENNWKTVHLLLLQTRKCCQKS